MTNEKYQSNLQLTEILLNFIYAGEGVGVGGGGGMECKIVIRHSGTVLTKQP